MIQLRSSHLSTLLSMALAIGLIATSSLAEAARVTRVKGTQVLIDTEGSSEVTKGSRHLVIVGGKRKAVVEIQNVRGSKAVGKVLKGSASVDGALTPLTAQNAKTTTKKTAKKKNSRTPKETGPVTFENMVVGVLGGMGLASQDVTVTIQPSNAKQTVSMSGSGFNLKAFGDLPVSGKFGLIGRAGVDQFSVSGTASNGVKAKTDITYLSVDLLARYSLLEGSFDIYPLAGLGLHYPISKSTNVLQVQQISATTIFFFGAGANYKLNDTTYIVASGEYGLFMPSEDVKTSLIAFRFGMGWLL